MDMVSLRTAVEEMDREMSALAGPPTGLRAAWSRLVGALALGPAPSMRNCPRCGKAGMRDATVCGYCWTRLVPPDAAGH